MTGPLPLQIFLTHAHRLLDSAEAELTVLQVGGAVHGPPSRTLEALEHIRCHAEAHGLPRMAAEAGGARQRLGAVDVIELPHLLDAVAALRLWVSVVEHVGPVGDDWPAEPLAGSATGGAEGLDETWRSVAELVRALDALTQRMAEQVGETAARAQAVAASAIEIRDSMQGVMEASRAEPAQNSARWTVASVAHRTHLLALDANIEVSRAEQAGRGVARVASEVKVLADRTLSATRSAGDGAREVLREVYRLARAVRRLRSAPGESAEVVAYGIQTYARVERLASELAALVARLDRADQARP